jgi:hypothetical protein
MTQKDPDTGEPVAVPPPAEAGPSVLHGVDKGVTIWLRAVLMSEPLRNKHLLDAISENALTGQRPQR